ncbi:branched-chain amino acid ABC transporter permease [Bradyrhizobium guangdongense]|uniref:Branched-chain amino acid ABC transporter permease n=1 Tax=Bradyrhizobium guangdongense TaxID=1325090 RepID=A0A410V3K8_9BRAD|nr:branched-chain amino acid ABC transporter permease [Bradyrhizobium guangdongense]QAU38228.1 branched-chain amino acid ABC transporter permease [Bradyrhizobium guangdongense]QOZ59281.1 branched-chain amino acid ABC transporter permease [Bradyrhizobium guangdongense]GGI33925.1 branched-chain amino acid ABC transporter permease [Bradyrhizobium guangdongense]
MKENRRPAMREAAIAALALIVVLAIPFVHRSPAFEDFVIRLSAMALFATSLNLLVGNTGMVSFGHGLFYGLGAYAFALMMQMTELSLPVAAVLAVLFTAVAALCVGAICVRLSTDYFAFITLAFQMLIYSVIISWQSLTGGDQGLRGGLPRREIFGFELASQLHLYQFCAVVAVIGLLALRHISASPFGQTLRMIRDNDSRTSFLGVVLWRARLWAFTIAGSFAGLGGVLAALFVSGAYPELADWPNSGQAIFAVMLGGINSFLGPLLGAAILLALNDLLARTTEYQGLVLGIVVLIFAVGLRRGVLDFLRRAWPSSLR